MEVRAANEWQWTQTPELSLNRGSNGSIHVIYILPQLKIFF
jgi:hypothetical protein